MIKLLAAAILLWSASVQAGELWATGGGLSYHTQRDRGYNERNLGFGLEYRSDKSNSIGAGTYRNSFRNDSVLIGHTWTPIGNDTVRAGILWGTVTGYAGGPSPILLPMITVERGMFGIALTAWPPLRGESGGVALQLKLRLW